MEDLSSFGTPVETQPVQQAEDLSSYGQAVVIKDDYEILPAPEVSVGGSKYFPDEQDSLDKVRSIIGAGEAVVGGAISMLGMGLDGIMNLLRVGANSMLDLNPPGMGFGELFVRESKRRPQFGQKFSAWMHEDMSPAGHEMEAALGRIFDAPVKALGDSNFERMQDAGASPEASAIMGAVGQTTGVLGELLLGAGRPSKAGPIDVPMGEYRPEFKRDEGVVDVMDLNVLPLENKPTGGLKKDYPNTAAAIDASKVGYENIAFETRIDGGNTHTLDIISKAVDKELGLTPDVLMKNPELRTMPMDAKLRAIVTKAAASKGEVVDPVTVEKYVSEAMDHINTLDEIRNGPKLPEFIEPPPTYVLDKPITVDPSGTARTAEQYVAEAQRIQNMTPENRAVEMGIGPMGVVRTMFNDMKAAEAIAEQSGHPRDMATYKNAIHDLETQWNSIFDRPRSAQQRTDAMNQYISRMGDMSYDEASRLVGDRNTGRGSFTPDTTWAKPLGDEVVRFAEAGILKPATSLGKPEQRAQMYRVTPEGESTKLAPGAWLTDDGMYAQTYAAREGGVVTTHIVPIKNMAEVSASRYIYTPPGTPVGNLTRFIDPSGNLVKFNDILPPPSGGSTGGASAGGKSSFKGGKQKGMFIPPEEVGIKKAADDLNRIRVAKPIDDHKKKAKAAPKPGDAKKAEQAWENNEVKLKEQAKFDGKRVVDTVYRGLFGHDRTMRDNLRIYSAGSEKALYAMTAESGAGAAAHAYGLRVNEALFDKLTYAQRKMVDKVTNLRRISQIDMNKGEGRVQHMDGISGADARAELKRMEKEDPGAYALADNVATKIFMEQRRLLDFLLDGQVISKDTHSKLYPLDYQRREYVEMIDPPDGILSNNASKQITSSGIEYLKTGANAKAVNTNAKSLLHEDIIRAHNSVARNKTLLALRDVAVKTPNDMLQPMPSGSYKIDKVTGDWSVVYEPSGWKALGVRVDGKQQYIAMRDVYAEQFKSNMNVDMSPRLTAIVSTLSLVKPIKATSTRYNPLFPIAGIPMDIIHVFTATQGTYSTVFPKYLLQIGKDMISVAGDVAKGGQLTQRALELGMGNALLVHEGLGRTYDMNENWLGNISDKYARVKAGLSWVGEKADLWVRVAHVKRLLDMGLSMEAAVAEAKLRLDGSQFGAISKVLDPGIPYFNISMQALQVSANKTVIAMFKEQQLPFTIQKALEDKGKKPMDTRLEAILKVATMMVTLGTYVYTAMNGSPKCWDNISDEDKIRNANICLGDDMYVVEDGVKRYMYVPIRLDASATPFNAAVIAGLSEALGRNIPPDMFTNTIRQIIPMSDTWFPIVNAVMIANGKDPRSDMNVGGNMNMNPEAQVKTFADRGGPTDPAFVAIGEALGQNPAALQAAAKVGVNTNNGYLRAINAIGQLFGDERPEDIGKSNEQIFLQQPGLSSIVKLTTGNRESMKALMAASKESNTKHALTINRIKELDFMVRNGRESVSAVQTYIKSLPPVEQKAMYEYAKHDLQVDKIAERFRMGDGIPQKSVWMAASRSNDDARAKWYYDQWISAGPDDRRRMDGIVMQLNKVGNGFGGKMFMYHLQQEKKKLGTEQR